MKIAIIPIDNRPVCYNLPREIARIDKSLELYMPEKKLLGSLNSSADITGIIKWLDTIPKVDALIVALDTIAYGGLISSRRCDDTKAEIQKRLEEFKTKIPSQCKVYAFTSIMRISNNNVNEEEKDYWREYGKRIFEYSYNFHREGLNSTDIPKPIILDYLVTRKRNFEINKTYLDWLEKGIFNTLVFSKDDCAEFGFNVLESNIFEKIIKEKKLIGPNKTGIIKTGADEIPLTLFARAVADYNRVTPKISTKFLAPEYKNLISNYEDISIEKSVNGQISLSNCELATNDENADLILLINNFEDLQGEIVMEVKTQPFSGQFSLPKKPYILADVRFANGADNIFVEKFFKKPIDFENFFGYSAWNTSANSLGSLICAAIIRFCTQKNNFDETAFKKLQLIRFLDDWAYQANVRQALKKNSPRPDLRKLQKVMIPFEKKLQKIFRIEPVPHIKYKYPWKRYFEIEILFK